MLLPLLNAVTKRFTVLEENLVTMNRDFPTKMTDDYWIDDEYSFKLEREADFKNSAQTCAGEQAFLLSARYQMNLSNVWHHAGLTITNKVWTSYRIKDTLMMITDPFFQPIIDATINEKISVATSLSTTDCATIRQSEPKLFLVEKATCNETFKKICYKATDKNVTHEQLFLSLERVEWSLNIIKAEKGRAEYLINMYRSLKSFPKIRDEDAKSTVDNRPSFEEIMRIVDFHSKHFPDIASYDNELMTMYLSKLRAAVDFAEGYLDSIMMAPTVLNITNETMIHTFYAYPLNDETLLIKEYERYDASTDFFLNFFVFTIFDAVLAITAVATLAFACIRTYNSKGVYLSVKKRKADKKSRKAVKLVELVKPTHPDIEYTSTSSSSSSDDSSSSSGYSLSDCCKCKHC